jgi:tetratricopeptide (TPR) repeat protein
VRDESSRRESPLVRERLRGLRRDPRARPSKLNSRSYRLRFALTLFWAHLIGAPLLLGGVYAWGMLAIGCSAVCCLLASAYARSDLRLDPSAVVWTSLLLLAWTALQAMPLPCGLVHAFAPGAADGATAAQAVFRTSPPAWCSLSYDPGATRQEVVKGVALVATLMTAWILTAGSTRRDVLWMVAVSALTMSCVAVAHAVVGAQAVFGIYKPVEARAQLLLAPLLNANTLGGFIALGPALWIGLTHRHRLPEVRWWGRIAAVITAVTAILSLSRGAIGQVLGTLGFMAGYIQFRSQRSSKPTPPRRWTAGLLVLGTGGLAVALGAYIAGTQVAEEFEVGGLGKLALVGRAFAFAAEHPWIGVGRGAFSSAFLSVAGREVRYGYAENFLAQWASEWGVPITLLWIGVVLAALVRRLRTAKSLPSIGAATALLGLCAQNLVDLGFELVGVATVAIALLGALLSPTGVRSRAPEASGVGMRAAIALGLAAGVASLIALGPHLEKGSVPALESSLRASLHGRQRTAFRETLQRAITLHPAEPLFPILAATEALRHDDPRTPRWLNRAMELAPHWGVPHMLAFQWLWPRGHRSQALLEFKLAAERDRSQELLEHQLCLLAQRNGELALAVVPAGDHRRPVMEMAGRCMPRDSRASELIDRMLLREFPDSPGALERSAYRVARDGDVDRALAMFASLLRTRPDWDSARISRAGVLQIAERYDELVGVVDRDLSETAPAHRPELLRAQAYAFAKLGDLEGMRRSLETYRRLVGTTAEALAEAYAFEGSLQLQLENFGAALSAFHEAYRINGATRHLAAVANMARQLGNRSQELWAYMQLCDREPVGTTYCAERDRLLAPPSAPL